MRRKRYGLLGLQANDAYNRAGTILQERFGDPFKICEAYNEKLNSWPVCTKGHKLQEFSDFLVTIQETMKTVKYLEDFNTFAAIFKNWLQDYHHIITRSGYKVQRTLNFQRESMISTIW